PVDASSVEQATSPANATTRDDASTWAKRRFIGGPPGFGRAQQVAYQCAVMCAIDELRPNREDSPRQRSSNHLCDRIFRRPWWAVAGADHRRRQGGHLLLERRREGGATRKVAP